MNEKIISAAFRKNLEKFWQDTVFVNFFAGDFEMDIFRLTSSSYIWEYEIKTSRADFFNDFKKQKNWNNKHAQLKEGLLCCNRFSFIVPKWLVTLEEVPEYAGLIYYEDNRFSTYRQAPLLKKEKNTDENKFLLKLLKKTALRDNLRKEQIRRLNRRIKLLSN